MLLQVFDNNTLLCYLQVVWSEFSFWCKPSPQTFLPIFHMDLGLLDFNKQFTNNAQYLNLHQTFELIVLSVAINVVETNLCTSLLIFDLFIYFHIASLQLLDPFMLDLFLKLLCCYKFFGTSNSGLFYSLEHWCFLLGTLTNVFYFFLQNVIYFYSCNCFE